MKRLNILILVFFVLCSLSVFSLQNTAEINITFGYDYINYSKIDCTEKPNRYTTTESFYNSASDVTLGTDSFKCAYYDLDTYTIGNSSSVGNYEGAVYGLMEYSTCASGFCGMDLVYQLNDTMKLNYDSIVEIGDSDSCFFLTTHDGKDIHLGDCSYNGGGTTTEYYSEDYDCTSEPKTTHTIGSIVYSQWNLSTLDSCSVTENLLKNVTSLRIASSNPNNNGGFARYLDELYFTYLNGTNELPTFNVTIPSVACINDTTRMVIVNFTINDQDVENDTIYYAHGINVFDEGLFFTGFNLDDCTLLDVFNLRNDYMEVKQFTGNEMGNGISSIYYNETHLCTVKLDIDTYVNTTSYGKTLTFKRLQILDYTPDMYFKLFFPENNSIVDLSFTDTSFTLYNNVTFERLDNTVLIKQYGILVNNISNTPYIQLKLEHLTDSIYIFQCNEDTCQDTNLLVQINNTISDYPNLYTNFFIRKNYVYLDDVIFSTQTVGDFSTVQPNSITLNGINNHYVRFWISDEENQPDRYTQQIYKITTFHEDYCYSGELMDDTGIEFTNPNQLTGISLLFSQFIWFLRIPYHLAELFGYTIHLQLAGSVALFFILFGIVKTGLFQNVHIVIWALFGIATIFQLMLIILIPVYILITLLFTFSVAVTIFQGGTNE